MIALKVNDQWVDINSPSILFKSINPIFTNDLGYGEYSEVPFSVIYNSRAQLAFNFPDSLHIADYETTHTAELYLDQTLYKTGVVDIKNISENKITLSFRSGMGELSAIFNTTNLNAIDIGFIDIWEDLNPQIEVVMLDTDDLTIYYVDETAQAKTLASQSPYLTVTISNPWDGVTGGPEAHTPTMVAAINDADLPIYAVNDDVGNYGRFWIYHKLYWFGAQANDNEFDVTTMNAQTGWSATSVRLSNDDLEDRFTLLMQTQSDAADKVVFPTIRNTSASSEEANIDYFNHYHGGEYATTDSFNVPMFKLKFILDSLFSKFGFTTVYHSDIDTDWEKLTLFANANYYFTSLFRHWPHYPTPEEKVYIHKSMPDILLADFIYEIEKYLGVYFKVDARTRRCFITPIKYLVTSNTEQTLSNIISIQPGDLSSSYAGGVSLGQSADSDSTILEYNEPSSYPLRFTVDTFADLPTDQLYVDDLAYVIDEHAIYKTDNALLWVIEVEVLSDTIAIDNGTIDWTTNFSIVDNVSEADDLNGAKSWLLPSINQSATYIPGRYENIGDGLGYNDPGLKLLIWHGFQDDSQSNVYPLATQLDKDYDDNTISTFTLRFRKDPPLYDYQYKFWQTVTNSREAKVICVMNKFELLELDPLYIFTNQNHRWIIQSYTSQLIGNSDNVVVTFKMLSI